MLAEVLIPAAGADFTSVGESLIGSCISKGSGKGSDSLIGAFGGIAGTKELYADVGFKGK